MKGEVIIALDFGYGRDEDKLSNVDEIALETLRYAVFHDEWNCVILAQSKVFETIKRLSTWEINQIFELPTGQSTFMGTENGTTWQALCAAKEFMDQHNLGADAVLFTHDLHFERAQKQAARIGISVRKPKNAVLPVLCYRNAAQWWCRSRLLWRLRESFGSILLKRKGQL